MYKMAVQQVAASRTQKSRTQDRKTGQKESITQTRRTGDSRGASHEDQSPLGHRRTRQERTVANYF